MAGQKRRIDWSQWIPASWTALREGYSRAQLSQDLLAGITIGILSLPLAMAFAIGGGLSPEHGLYTAVVAGFLIAACGGSRFQIGGPTGAFIVIVADVVQRHGYEGLALATLMAGAMLVVMGLLRLGAILKFIPYPVLTGLTTGIAVVLFSSQIKDFFGLQMELPSADFLSKWSEYVHHFSSWQIAPLAMSLAGVAIIIFFRKKFPKIPGAILVVVMGVALTHFFKIPVETIASHFGNIPSTLPSPSLPLFSLESVQQMLPDAIIIAILAGVESLLSAAVADGMTGCRHKSNCELIAQGLGNIGAVLFGGIPATGAIARTATNVRLGARTPISGMVHAITLLIILFSLAPLAGMIPLCCLAAILVVIAWNMAEWHRFVALLRGTKSDISLLLITFCLTVLVDLTIAVEVGVLLGAVLFMKRMADVTTVKIAQKILQTETAEGLPYEHPETLPGIVLLDIEGPLFFGAADLFKEIVMQPTEEHRVIILRMKGVPVIDATGVQALLDFHSQCERMHIALLLSDVNVSVTRTLLKTSEEKVWDGALFTNTDRALEKARHLLPHNVSKEPLPA